MEFRLIRDRLPTVHLMQCVAPAWGRACSPSLNIDESTLKSSSTIFLVGFGEGLGVGLEPPSLNIDNPILKSSSTTFLVGFGEGWGLTGVGILEKAPKLRLEFGYSH
jgi:hypothetical protein